MMVLLGRSGSGKTTLLRLINRLLDPTAGEVLVENIPTSQWDPIQLRRRIGYVIQEGALFPHLTVEENIGIVPSLKGWNKKKIRARVHELLELVGLDPKKFTSSYPKELSGGQCQRVGVARALAADPPILLFDEPFGSLDTITRAEIQNEFHSLQNKLQKTHVFVTHDVHEAFLLATRIAIMQDGMIIFVGTPDEVKKSDHPEVRAILA
jgi:osmoprotectant transport system ATP-binding protein